jgi:fructose-bisphosphate aldolase class I
MYIDTSLLDATVAKILSPPRGIFAADQTPDALSSYISSPLDSISARTSFRESTLTYPSLAPYVGGVILHSESVLSSTPWASILEKNNIITGGTVDQDPKFGKLSTGEPVSLGADVLETQMEEYKDRGIRFLKWRSILHVDVSKGWPSEEALEKNLELSANYASIAQSKGLVPVCEPDLQFAGDHDEKVFKEVSIRAWDLLFKVFL